MNIEDIKKELNARGINWLDDCPSLYSDGFTCPEDIQWSMDTDDCAICWKRCLEVEDNG